MVKPKKEPPVAVGDIIQWNTEKYSGFLWASYVVVDVPENWHSLSVWERRFYAVILDAHPSFLAYRDCDCENQVEFHWNDAVIHVDFGDNND